MEPVLTKHGGWNRPFALCGLIALHGLHGCSIPVFYSPCELPPPSSEDPGGVEICGLPIVVLERDLQPLTAGDDVENHRIAAQWSNDLSADERGLARAECERPRVAGLHQDLQFLDDGVFISPVIETAFVSLTPSEFDRWLDGEETVLRCVLESLAVEALYENDATATLQVDFSRPYSPTILATLLRSLPGVEAVDASNTTPGELPLVRVSLDEGDVATWLIRTGSGDCPSGCIHHQYHLATSDPAGTVTLLASYDDSSPLAGPPPSWIPDEVLR